VAELQTLKGELGYKGQVNNKMRADILFIKLRPELRIEISRRGKTPIICRGLIDLARFIKISKWLFGLE
jgi:hypothetical protein